MINDGDGTYGRVGEDNFVTRRIAKLFNVNLKMNSSSVPPGAMAKHTSHVSSSDNVRLAPKLN